jgi:hypothetical protein
MIITSGTRLPTILSAPSLGILPLNGENYTLSRPNSQLWIVFQVACVV